MRNMTLAVAIVLLIPVMAGVSLADGEGPLTAIALKTKTMVDTAYDYVLDHEDDMSVVQYAFRHDPRFIDREDQLYIYMHYYRVDAKEAICCGQGARPELIGKNMWNLRTPNGRLLFKEISELLSREPQGWIEYDWLNPYTQRIQTKCSYVRKITLKGGRTAWIGSGYWKN